MMSACSQDESVTYTTPFIRIATSTGASKTIVKSDVKNVNTYNVILSSAPLSESFTVNYEVIAGNGLQSGVDYEMVTQGGTLTFLPGIYDMPVRVRWLEHQVDTTKNNTLTIRLVSNSKKFTMGYPGPDGLQKEVVIEKQNE